MGEHLLGVQMIGVALGGVLGHIGSSLREGFFMLWGTLWALVLGFGVSGAVQAFASRESMQAKLGNHRPAAVIRASGYGMASSSCSYAASAMARSLFAKGADFVTAMIFMFASTNLVVELGIVVVVLIGWQFAAAEFLGGSIMIVALALVGGTALSGRTVRRARARLTRAGEAETAPAVGTPAAGTPAAGTPVVGVEMAPVVNVKMAPAVGAGHQCGAGPHGSAPSPGPTTELQDHAWRVRLRSRVGWADAASFTIADLKMLRREIAVGFVVAGFLATLVPASWWNTVFIHGHGAWTSVENALVGPLIALVSCVCSIGNVPLAAALWKGGISFGGVVSFLFGDLIALPVLFVYRKLYGPRLALRLLGVFWGVMAGAGLLTGAIFGAAGLVPSARPTRIVPEAISWNYTPFSNIVALAVLVLLYRCYRSRRSLGGSSVYALDPVCGMQVTTASAPASSQHNGQSLWFCSDRCRERFEADPERYLAKETLTPTN